MGIPPNVKQSEIVKRGNTLGMVMEHRFQHLIMVPFHCYGDYTITWIAPKGQYTVNAIIARAVDEKGE